MNRMLFALATGILLLSGCQPSVSTDYHKLDLAQVSGTIRLDGEPLENVHVMFQSSDQTFSFGQTDTKGNYTLNFNTEKTGILPGPKTVRIRRNGSYSSEGGIEEEQDLDEGEAPARQADVSELPPSYHRDSHLNVEVSSGTQTIDFDLKPDGSTKAAS